VDEHLPGYSASELVDFECECNAHYTEYRKNGEWPLGTTAECQQFIACLNNQKSASVKVLTGLAKGLSKTITVTIGAGCFTPSPEKYKELTECNCLKGLLKHCGNDAGTETTDECLKAHACKKDDVCQEWKDENCANLFPHDSLSQLRANHQQLNNSADSRNPGALQQRAGRVQKDANGDTDQPNRALENTVSAKQCD
jgi:hypothetical protein